MTHGPSDPAIETHPIGDPAEWLERRRSYLNASEIAAKFGLHDYMTLAQLTAHKRGLAGLDADPESALIRRGHALEDDAKDEIQKLRPTWFISHNEHHYIDPVARIACTPDFLVSDPAREGIGALQVKVVSAPVFRRKWIDATPPLGYVLQVATEMMLTPACTWGAIGALVIGDFQFEAHVFEVDRNKQAEIRLRTAAAEFWHAFDRGDIPTIDFERDGALIALMYPNEVPGKVVDLSTDNSVGDLLERREILKATEKDVQTRLKQTETEIRSKLGDAEAALVPGWRVTLKTQHRAGYQVAPTSFRVLRAARDAHEVRESS